MPSKPKHNHANGTASNTPVLHFEFIERLSSDPFMMDVRVLDQLEQYTHYIESIRGKKPTKDEVVEKALERVLASDSGFQKYLAAGNGKANSKQKVAAGNEPSEAVGNRQETAAQAG